MEAGVLAGLRVVPLQKIVKVGKTSLCALMSLKVQSPVLKRKSEQTVASQGPDPFQVTGFHS